MKSVIWLAGGHRSGSNALGLALVACGAQTCGRVSPQASAWNEVYSDDMELLARTSFVTGNHPVGSLPIPEEPAEPELWAIDEIRRYVSEKFQQAKAHYLLKSNVAGGLYRLLLPVFPDVTRHIMVSLRRNTDSQVQSLATRTGATSDECGAYLARIEATQREMERDFESRGWAVARCFFEAIMASPATTFPVVATACGLTVTPEALAVFDPRQVRF